MAEIFVLFGNSFKICVVDGEADENKLLSEE